MAATLGNTLDHALAAALRSSAATSLLGQFVNLPSSFKTPGKELGDKDFYLNKLEALKTLPIKQLQEAAQILAQLNRFTLKNDKRVQFSQAVLIYVYPIMARHYQLYQAHQISLPESPERRQAILACIEITEHAAIAYKHLFRELYAAKDLAYRRMHDKVQEIAVRILELLRLNQRFRALRHQKLPANAWQDINRVFFSMLAHNDIDVAVPLLGAIGTWARSSKSNAVSQGSCRKIYLSIQFFGVLDVSSWSTRLFHAPDSYLENFENLFSIVGDNQQDIQPGQLLSGIDHNGPPLFNRDTRMASPCILIEYGQLYNRLVQDYEDLAKMKFIGDVDVKRLGKPLAGLEPMERLPFLEVMLFGLRPRERRQKRHAAFDDEGLRLYFGFRDAFRLLSEQADASLRRVTDTHTFGGSLVGHSAGVADISNYQQSKWQIANFSTGGILVINRESSYTAPIQIGQIAAFNPSQDLKRPLIGYVSRIHRPSDQQIELAVVRLSNHAEVGLIQLDSAKQGGQRLGAILFQSMEGKWCLIARHEYDLVFGTPLRLTRENNKQLPARLGNVLLTKQEFVVFELSAPGM